MRNFEKISQLHAEKRGKTLKLPVKPKTKGGNMDPLKSTVTVIKQFFQFIPRNLIPKLAKKHGVDKKARTFSPTSHMTSLMYSQLAHSISLNDTCDALRNHSGVLTTLRESTPPSRNGLSHANQVRNADMAEELFWEVKAQLEKVHPQFGYRSRPGGKGYVGIPRRFKRTINAVDSTTIQLVANCMDWAKHRRQKAAAKMHLRLDLGTFLPRFAIVKSAKNNDAHEAAAVCADLIAGEIVVFDKAYVDFIHLYDLTKRGVFWVTRGKDNMQYEVVRSLSDPKGNIIRDVEIKLKSAKTDENYGGQTLRLVEAWVEIKGEKKQMIFITNNFTWAASSICELYRARWGIEVFFKEIKQTLQLADFMGYSENAIRWQIWSAMLVYMLLRYISYLSGWKGTFNRLFTAIRAVLWSALDMMDVLKCCQGEGARMRAAPEQSYLPGFDALFLA